MFPNEVLRFCKDYFGEDALSEKEWDDFGTNLIAKHECRFADEVSVLYLLMELNRRGFATSINGAMKMIDICESELKEHINKFLYTMVGSFISDHYMQDDEVAKIADGHESLKRGIVRYLDNSNNLVDEKICDLKDKGY